MSTTYQQLINAVKGFSGRTDAKTLDQIPAFIAAAQTKLDGDLRVPSMTQVKSYDDHGLSIANEFMEIETVIIGERLGVLMPLEHILKARKLAVDESRAYALTGNTIELASLEPVIVTGFQKPQRLSEQQPTNAYTEHAENALLWQSLAFLGVFARDAKAAQSWGGMASAEIDNINMQYEKYKAGSGVDSVPPIRPF